MLNKKAIIGISTNYLIETVGAELGQERAYVNCAYFDAVIKAGGIPLLLPFVEEQAIARAQMEQIDGLLLSGGIDVNPHIYGEEPHPMLGPIYPKRDAHELHLIQIAKEANKPILGICRGLQIINAAFGGSLYQDIPYMTNTEIQHSQKVQKHIATHTVELKRRSILREIFGNETLMTNSLHHQAIKQLADSFTVSACTKDGIIEGIEKPNDPFILGVQWHPEMMIPYDPKMQKLFDFFIGFVEKNKSVRS